MDRMAQAAEAFENVAPQMMATETMHQRALTPPPRFKLRVGKAAEQPLTATWQEREIVSQYGYAVFGAGSIQELRQVMAVNGKRIADQGQAQADLVKLVTGSNEQRKRRALLQFQKYGFRGGATDLGQILLLFSRYNVDRYEITYEGNRLLSSMLVQVFHYKQIDGPETLTLFRQDASSKDAGLQTKHLTVEGEIWLRQSDQLPARITLVATDDGSGQPLREDATVDYAPSEFGTILPSQTDHKETRGGDVVSENKFTYSGFHRFNLAR
jgi:hypothetical protein